MFNREAAEELATYLSSKIPFRTIIHGMDIGYCVLTHNHEITIYPESLEDDAFLNEIIDVYNTSKDEIRYNLPKEFGHRWGEFKIDRQTYSVSCKKCGLELFYDFSKEFFGDHLMWKYDPNIQKRKSKLFAPRDMKYFNPENELSCKDRIVKSILT